MAAEFPRIGHGFIALSSPWKVSTHRCASNEWWRFGVVETDPGARPVCHQMVLWRNSMNVRILGIAVVLATAVVAPAFAASINTVETTVGSGTAGVVLDQNPVIDYIASQPGTLDGY